MVVVILEFVVAPGQEGKYVRFNESLEIALQRIDGFVSCNRFQNLVARNLILSLTTWRDEAAFKSWIGSEAWFIVSVDAASMFTSYRMRVAHVSTDAGIGRTN
jgi:heme-degrading monooxygenase HmoA